MFNGLALVSTTVNLHTGN